MTLFLVSRIVSGRKLKVRSEGELALGIARNHLWLVPGAISLSVAALAVSPPIYRAFKPGPVTPDSANRFVLSGSFTVAPDTIVSAIQDTSHGSGGACIFADLAKHGAPELACTNNTQCTQAWAGYYQANLDNPNFDAAAFGNVGNGACIANRCWFRGAVGVRACDRSPAIRALGHHKFGPFSFQHVADMYGEDARIDWQVVTCANRAQPDGTDAPSCSQGAGIYNPAAAAAPPYSATDWETKTRKPPTQ